MVYPNGTANQAKQASLHPSPRSTVTRLDDIDFRTPPEIGKANILHGCTRHLQHDPCPRLLRLLATTTMCPEASPEASVTGLSSLTDLVRRLGGGDLPSPAIPHFSASTLLRLRLQPWPYKIWPLASGQSLRRRVSKVLCLAALSDFRGSLAPHANSILSGMDGRYRSRRSNTCESTLPRP